MSAIDLSGMSDKELRLTLDAIVQEQALRRRLDASPEKIEHAISEYQVATGRGTGEAWAQPVSALDAYRKGAEVEHDGQLWVSTHSANVHAPGTSGWRLKPETDDDGNEIPPPFVPPTGSHDSYGEGEMITWVDGNIYRAARNGVVHSPDEYAPDWILVEAEPVEPDPPEDDEDDDGNGDTGNGEDEESEPEPEPEPEEPPEEEDPDPEDPTDPEEPEPGDGEGDEDDEPDEPEPEPELPEWKTGVDYQPGDRLTYGGAEYRVLQAHTSAAHWPPDAVPALYERQG